MSYYCLGDRECGYPPFHLCASAGIGNRRLWNSFSFVMVAIRRAADIWSRSPSMHSTKCTLSQLPPSSSAAPLLKAALAAKIRWCGKRTPTSRAKFSRQSNCSSNRSNNNNNKTAAQQTLSLHLPASGDGQLSSLSALSPLSSPRRLQRQKQ